MDDENPIFNKDLAKQFVEQFRSCPRIFEIQVSAENAEKLTLLADNPHGFIRAMLDERLEGVQLKTCPRCETQFVCGPGTQHHSGRKYCSSAACRVAAMRKRQRETEKALAFADEQAAKVESLLEPHVEWSDVANAGTTVTNDTLADDLLTGAKEIADFLGWNPRRVFHAAAQGHLPIKSIGRMLIARKSELERAFSFDAASRQELFPRKTEPRKSAPPRTRAGAESSSVAH